MPAQTRARPGVYSGPAATTASGHHWLWLALAVTFAVAAAVIVAVRRSHLRRDTTPAR
jgi:hypothetical protein